MLGYWFKEKREMYTDLDGTIEYLSVEFEIENVSDEQAAELRNIIDEFCKKGCT